METERDDREWEQVDHDPVSGRRIFKADTLHSGGRLGGTYDFKIEADFEVRDETGLVLMRSSGSASGEYWCGVTLTFVDGSDGKQVRLWESDVDDAQIYSVPDRPSERPVLQK